MNNQNQVRISFAGLKQDHNKYKYHDITFQSTKTPSHSHSQSILIREPPLRNNISYQKFEPFMVHPRNSTFGNTSSNSSKFANTIKQKNIENNSNAAKSQNNNLLEQSFMEIQKSVKSQIERYNSKYLEVTEILADMHIKDIMKLNEILKKNEESFEKWKGNSKNLANINFIQSSMEEIKNIYEAEMALIKIISEPSKSFDFRSTYESKNNQKTLSGGSSQISPQLIKNNQSEIQKNKFQVSENLIGSYEIEQRSSQGNVEDTPESVKSKISFTSKVKTEKDVTIGMFDRINICESVEEIFPQSSTFRSEKSKVKKGHRYGDSSEEDEM